MLSYFLPLLFGTSSVVDFLLLISCHSGSLAPFSALSSHSIKELDISSLTFPRAVSMKHCFQRSYEYSVWYTNWTYYVHKGLTAKKQHVFSLLTPQSKKQCFKLVLLFHYFYHIHLLYYKVNIFFKDSLFVYCVSNKYFITTMNRKKCIMCHK